MIDARQLPENAILRDYMARGYTDCFVTDVDGRVAFEAYVGAFYTTHVFRIERFILRWLASRPSTDEDVARLADGTGSEFAAWRVERRAEDQLLLADFRGHTRSWLMVESLHDRGATRLYFGSAVLARRTDETGAQSLTPGYRMLLGFHRLYSRILLRAARARLARTSRQRDRRANGQ